MKYRLYHVLGDRPVNVDINGTKCEIPPDWLIFNAPRPLYATEKQGVVIREAMTIGEFEYPELRQSIYLDWQGLFLHGRFYVAVDPEDEECIRRNVSLDGWSIVYHTKDDLIAWATRYYKEYYNIADVTKHPAYNELSTLRYALDELNEQARNDFMADDD